MARLSVNTLPRGSKVIVKESSGVVIQAMGVVEAAVFPRCCIDVLGLGTQGPDVRLLTGTVLKWVELVPTAGVLPRDHVRFRVGKARGRHHLHHHLGRVRPRRVGVWEIAFPRDRVDADEIANPFSRIVTVPVGVPEPEPLTATAKVMGPPKV